MLLLALWNGCTGCKSCQPDLPSETGDSDPVPTDTDPVETGDTAPEPPCPTPESEPNGDPADPDELLLEVEACGEFQNALDIDWWAFDVAEADWISVRVDARVFGSRADPMILLESGDEKVEARDDPAREDVFLRFPAVAGRWTAFLTDELGAGGPDEFPYRLLVGTAKVPVDWSDTDAEPNDAQTEAQDVEPGDAVFGAIDHAGDVDVFRVTLPLGKAALVLDVDASDEGSPANLAVDLLDATGAIVASARYGPQGWEHDPLLEHVSSGNETLWIRVREESSRGGAAYWYRLSVEREAT